MYSIGIDPGFNGAIAVIHNKEGIAMLRDMPIIKVGTKRAYDINEMVDLLIPYASFDDTVVILEQSQAMPKQGVSSTFKTGVGYGAWLGIIGALKMKLRTIHPRVWSNTVFKGMTGQGKSRSILFAKQMYPEAELCPGRTKKPKDGRSDAICIAHYGLMIEV